MIRENEKRVWKVYVWMVWLREKVPKIETQTKEVKKVIKKPKPAKYFFVKHLCSYTCIHTCKPI